MGYSMKSMLRRALRSFGYDVIRCTDMPERPFDVLKLLVDRRIAAGQSVRFIQIGANDGVRNDPIRDLVVRHRLSGLLVEPLPDLFARLQTNYAGHQGIRFEQCAVGDNDGQAVLYRVRGDAGLPEWLQSIASFNKRHLSSRRFGIRGLEKHIVPVTVPVLTLTSLLRKHDMDGCDLLQIDTEGFDCRIVRSAIHAGLRPAIINYEFIHTNPAERARCKQVLADHGYAFLDVGRDTLAVHEEQQERSRG